MTLDELIAIEEIKQLKARYFRFTDTKDWAALRAEVFTADLNFVVIPCPGEEPWIVNDRDNYIDTISQALAEASLVHHGHMPEITITGENTATGIRAMHDTVEKPTFVLEGWGHYHEQYRREEDGAWRIAEVTLTRLRGYRKYY